jgi:aminomethyltransferase
MPAKRTPLYDSHVTHGAKVIDFHGWEMPVQYQGIVREHNAVRNDVGVFDVSHMGEFLVEGPESEKLVQYLVTNDITRLVAGKALYTLMVNEEGGTIDDLLVYKLGEQRFLLVVNAGNIERDFEWVQEHAKSFQVSLSNISDKVALIALQGPRAVELLAPITGSSIPELAPFTFTVTKVLSHKAMVSRTGYTGEDGFEIYVSSAAARQIFDDLVLKGATPCGLGARDTLRLEAKLALYGNELSETVSPYEAGLGMFVKLNKGDFIGREALKAQQEHGVARKIVGIAMQDRSIPRSGYRVFVGDEQIGEVTSGTMSVTLQTSIGLVLIDSRYVLVDQHVEVEIRGKRHPATVIPTPFYKRIKP